MICRETRASDWLCQQSRVRPMTTDSFIRVMIREPRGATNSRRGEWYGAVWWSWAYMWEMFNSRHLLWPSTSGDVFCSIKNMTPSSPYLDPGISHPPPQNLKSQNLDRQHHVDLTQMTQNFTQCHDENIWNKRIFRLNHSSLWQGTPFETIYFKCHICRSVFLLLDFTGILPVDCATALSNPNYLQSHVVMKIWYTILISSSISRNITYIVLRSSSGTCIEKYFNDLFGRSRN